MSTAATGSSALNLNAKHQTSIRDSLNTVESRISEWLSPSHQAQWKHHKTSINMVLNIRCSHEDDIRKIKIHSLKDPKNKKCTVWRAIGHIPCADPKIAVDYFNMQSEYDDMNTMHKLELFPVAMTAVNNSNPFEPDKYGINVAVTNSRLNGWISQRLSVSINCCKYSDELKAHCSLNRFINSNMLKELQSKLGITEEDFKHTMSKNLNVCWMAKPVKYTCANKKVIDLCEIQYIVQINNGGWIPQWAVEMGLIDQHMIAIFRQISKWLNMKERKRRNQGQNEQIIESQKKNEEMKKEIDNGEDEDADWIEVDDDGDIEIIKMQDLKSYDDGEDFLSDVVYVDEEERRDYEKQDVGCLLM